MITSIATGTIVILIELALWNREGVPIFKPLIGYIVMQALGYTVTGSLAFVLWMTTVTCVVLSVNLLLATLTAPR